MILFFISVNLDKVLRDFAFSRLRQKGGNMVYAIVEMRKD